MPELPALVQFVGVVILPIVCWALARVTVVAKPKPVRLTSGLISFAGALTTLALYVITWGNIDSHAHAGFTNFWIVISLIILLTGYGYAIWWIMEYANEQKGAYSLQR